MALSQESRFAIYREYKTRKGTTEVESLGSESEWGGTQRFAELLQPREPQRASRMVDEKKKTKTGKTSVCTLPQNPLLVLPDGPHLGLERRGSASCSITHAGPGGLEDEARGRQGWWV